MPPQLSPLDRVIRKLDRLDGRRDGHYLELALHQDNTTGACEVAQVATKVRPDAIVVVGIENSRGEVVSVNCTELVRKLNIIANIAAKLPVTRLMNGAPTSKQKPDSKIPAEKIEELLVGYYIVSDMIQNLLWADCAIDQPLSAHFEKLDFNAYSQFLKKAGFENFAVQGVQHGYKIFFGLGEKYKFNAKPFQPPPKPAPTLPPPSHYLSGPTENA